MSIKKPKKEFDGNQRVVGLAGKLVEDKTE